MMDSMKKDTSLDIDFYIIGWTCVGIGLIYVLLKYVLHIDVMEYIGGCVFHQITGFYCPGCGSTRAVFALYQGDVLKSFYYQPFIPYVIITGGWFMISQTMERVSQGKIKIAMHFRMIYVWIGLTLLFGNCIWKNAVLFFTGNALI